MFTLEALGLLRDLTLDSDYFIEPVGWGAVVVHAPTGCMLGVRFDGTFTSSHANWN